MPDNEPRLDFVLKVASTCNLNCSYCYVYNRGDTSWRERPALMPEPVFDAAVAQIADYCRRSGQRTVRITFHGGEPLLAGVRRVKSWCERIYAALLPICRVDIVLQTNGVLLDAKWLDLIRDQRISIGFSIDGPPGVHDLERVDHMGRGTYARVARGAARLRAAGVPLHFLTVVQPGLSGVAIHRHLASLEPVSINYLLPDYTHDTIGPLRAKHGATPCADFLIPIFEDWWTHGTLDLNIGLFWTIARAVLGGESEVDFLGNPPLRYIFIETDGAIEGLDVLRQCYEGAAAFGLNILRDELTAIRARKDTLSQAVFVGPALPTACSTCVEAETCGGGYLPHRYSSASAFDNPSVWCADLLSIFAHIRRRLEVGHDETILRRQVLAQQHAEAA